MFTYRKYIPTFISFFMVLATGAIIYFIWEDWYREPIQIENTLAANITNEKDETNLKNIIHQAQEAIVQIEATSDLNIKNGSGFLINNQGDILTNAHVVEGAESLVVTVANTRKYPAALIGLGEDQDIAVIRVPELNHIAPVSLDTEHQAEIGEEIIAIGSPLGIQNSVSLGLIVGTDRSFSINNFYYDQVYQISANITHGNSGGPLISRETGKVIGINSAGITDTDIGFSIPVPQVTDKVYGWIDEADEDNLNYLSPSDLTKHPEELEEDSFYITDYFFENISHRDYVNAYAVLGSNLQNQYNYTDLRQYFQSAVNVSVKNTKIQEKESNELQLIVELVIIKRDQSYKEKQVEETYQLITGYENDQIKILDMDKE